MAPGRRLQEQIENIQRSNKKTFRNITVDEWNEPTLQLQGLLVPDKEPYNKAAFKIQIHFPAEYPFKPPTVTFLTKIYHPNVSENGIICFPSCPVFYKEWKPATKVEQVIDSLITIINEPEPYEHVLRADLAREYTENREKFMKNAEDHAVKFGEKRPSD